MIRRLLVALVLVGAAAAAVVLTGASGGGSSERTIRIVFDNAFGITEGGDLRIGGVRAGKTTALSVSGDEPAKAVVEAVITQPGFGDLRRDAFCEIRPQSLIGEYFVDCQPGSSRDPLPNDTVPVKQTASTIPTDLLNNVLRRPYRERLRLIIAELGAGLAGRPEDLAETLRRAHPGLRETNKTLRILARQTKIIQDFIADSDVVVAELEDRKEDVARWVVEAGETAAISASRREALAGQFRRFPRFLDELEPTMARLGELSDEQVPLLADLRRAAPDLRRFFTELGPFAEASRPSFRSLGETSIAGRAAIVESKEEIDELAKLAKDAPRLGKPLRQFLQTIDDRDRYSQNEPEAAETAPPAPDKTARPEVKGFTGMEAFWRYFYDQTLAINGFDEISHQLRIFPVEGKTAEECAPYSVKPSKELQHDCAVYLGPYQPGVNQPDPTRGGAQAVAQARERDQRPARRGERRGAGEPEAPPRPGQRDISQPQFVLPPQLEELLDKLPELRLELDQLGKLQAEDLAALQDGRHVAPDQLLDFLLAP